MTKAQIIRAGHAAGVDFSLTHSCYDPTPDGLACGACDSCILRFAEEHTRGDPSRDSDEMNEPDPERERPEQEGDGGPEDRAIQDCALRKSHVCCLSFLTARAVI